MVDEQPAPDAVTVSSRLLPRLFEDDSPDEAFFLSLVDLGPARGGTLAFLGNYNCRLRILDIGRELQHWSAQWLANPDRSEDTMVAELDALLGPVPLPRAEIGLLWDSLNYLDAALLPIFARCLSRLLAPGALLYGFAALNNTTDLRQQFYDIVDREHLSVTPAAGSLPYRHTQAAIKGRLQGFAIEQTILREDKRLEMLLRYQGT